jgi:hypothetical protein
VFEIDPKRGASPAGRKCGCFGVVIVALFATACLSTGPIVLPDLSDPDQASEVTVIRKKSVVAAANSYKITLDGKDVFWMRSGQYTTFMVDPGSHVIGVRCFGGLLPMWFHDTVEFMFEPRQTHYFTVDPYGGLKCAKIEIVDQAEARDLIPSSEFVGSGH